MLKYTVQWTGFRYVNPRTLKPLDGELPVTIADLTKPRYEGGYGYPHDFPFFQPAKVDVSGWEWSVDISHIELEDPWDKLARVVGSELRVRSAIKLNPSPQQMRIRLNVDNDRTTLVLQCFETASSGLARELLHSHMVSIFSSPDRLLVCSDRREYKELVNQLYDFELKSILEDILDTEQGSAKRTMAMLAGLWEGVVARD